MMRSFRFAFFLVLFAFSVSTQAQAPAPTEKKPDAGPRNLTVDDYFQLKSVQDPQLSPDGKWVAYAVTSRDLKEEKSETQIWMIATAGGEAIPLTAKGSSAGRPRWSPDGKYLGFLASRGENARTQVWLLNRLGGEAQQLTEVKQGVGSFDWSPDGARLLLTIQDPTPEEAAETKEGAKPAKQKTRPPWVIDRLQFKRDYAGYLDRRRNHLYVFDVAAKKLSQITSGDFDDGDAEWSPDGRFIAFTSNRGDNPDGDFNADIWLVTSDNPDQGKNLLKLTSNPGPDSDPTWSPDGKWIAYVTATDVKNFWYATNYLAVVAVPAADAQPGAPNIITQKFDRNVSSPHFSADGKWIYFRLEDMGQDHLARIAPTGGEIMRPISGQITLGAYVMGKDGTIVTRISQTTIPGEIFVSEAGKLRQLTKVNDTFMAGIRLGNVEKVRFKSKDGTDVEAFITTPPAYAPEMKYPTLLRIHGGPVSQFDYGFNFESQLFAANGYAVVNVNPRGSSGYGQAFCSAIYADWGNKDYDDVMAGIDYAVAKGIADPNRMGVGGWSYGGILTNYVITKTARFKGAISGASEVLYIANYGHDHYQRHYEIELGLPWENRELWERLSPFNYVKNIVTPTLILGGEVDWNVPILNSEQLYQALRRLGRTTQLVVYPGEHHGISKPSYVKDRWDRYLAWYAKYVKGESEAPAAKPANE